MKVSAQTQLFSHVSFLDKLLFTKHLSIMIKSGITISEALAALASQAENDALRHMLQDVSKRVDNGEKLSSALERYPKTFDHLYTSLIEVSEEAGTLEQTLDFLADQLSKDYALRKKIQGVLLYPAIVVTAASVVGMAISLFVLPKLIDLFKSFNVTLPLETQILLFIAQLMKDWGILIFAGIFACFVLFRILISLPAIKPYWHRFILAVPVIGKFLQNSYMASMCRDLGTMLKSGLRITHALEIEYKASRNIVYKEYVDRIRKAVERGKSIGEELEKGQYKKIPSIATKMIAVGEKTGKLDEMFLYLSDFFEDEADDAAKNFSTVLEPVLLLVIGGMVAFVALAVISPIYSLTGSVK